MITLFRKSLIFLFLISFSILVKGDNIYQQRLSTLKFTIPLPYNDIVQSHIDRWVHQPDSSRQVLSLWKIFDPVIEKSLSGTDVPLELKYLPLALSQMNPNLTNSFGSAGFWQLMFQDARNYKLKITSFIDERRDPIKSSQAAAQYFKDLQVIYNDHLLAMAAFVSGPKTVNKAIISAGASINYWSVYPFLPAETREVIPQYVAAVYMAHFANQHGIEPSPSLFAYEGDTVVVDRNMRFDQIAGVLDISEAHLSFINPSFKKGFIPFSANPYKILVPKGKAATFESRRSEIPMTSAPKPDKEEPITQPAPTAQNPKFAKVVYKVRAGENINMVADYYDCTVWQIKSWNRLRSNRLNAGQWLAIWVPFDKKNDYDAIQSMTAAQKKQLMLKD